MGVADKMRKKAIPATSAKRSKKIVRTISKADSIELFRQLEPTFEQNKREYNSGLEAMEREGFFYKGEQISIVDPTDTKQQKLVKKL